MNRDRVNSTQFVAMLILYLLSGALITDNGRLTGRDTWLVILMSAVVMIGLACLYAAVTRAFPGKTLFEILETLMGRWVSRVLVVFLILYCLALTGLSTANLTLFIKNVSLRETPTFWVGLPFVLLCLWLGLSGIQVMGRMSMLLSILFVLFMLMVLAITAGQLDFTRMFPILNRPPEQVLRGGLATLGSPFTECMLFMVFSSKLSRGNLYRNYALGIGIGGFLFALASLRNVLLLGEYAFSHVFYPSSVALSLIEIGNYLQRFEAISMMTMLFSLIIRVGVCLYCANLGLLHLFPKLRTPVPLGILAVGAMTALLAVFDSAQKYLAFEKQQYWWFSLPINVGLPVILLVFTLVWKARKGKRAAAGIQESGG